MRKRMSGKLRVSRKKSKIVTLFVFFCVILQQLFDRCLATRTSCGDSTTVRRNYHAISGKSQLDLKRVNRVPNILSTLIALVCASFIYYTP